MDVCKVKVFDQGSLLDERLFKTMSKAVKWTNYFFGGVCEVSYNEVKHDVHIHGVSEQPITTMNGEYYIVYKINKVQ